MKTRLFIIIGVMPVIALADDTLPKRPDFNRYQAMLNRSFAVETKAVPTATPDFSKDLYIANVARDADGECFVSLASTTDKNFKEYVSTKGPNEHGFSIRDIQWSDPEK
jgi:hypothetical protein